MRVDQSEIAHNRSNRNLTFEELRQENITSNELLIWSASIDLVEEYEFYLNELNPSMSLFGNEVFYNCTKPWFGVRCEYSFEFDEDLSINDIVEREFSRKVLYFEQSTMSIPCYIHLRCDRGQSEFCLDWREICDGRIDCLNDGLDEAFCMSMEINQCNENEYRCHNGLCIPEEYWEDGMNEADCLDRSDEFPDVFYIRNCFQDPTFRCEEHSCRSNWHEFSCGDGQCVEKFAQCQNGRHLLLRKSLISQGDLQDQCYRTMICLTKLMEDIDGESCQLLTVESLRTCEDPIFQFPTIPVHLGHLRFFYKKTSLRLNESFFLYPDYICYDQRLCDCIHPTFSYRNFTCVHRDELQLEITISGHPWIDMIHQLNLHFSSCLVKEKRDNYLNSSSMYSCENSSKLISQARITDENKDCCLGDDENPSISCLFNDKYRIQCPDEDLCLSSLNSREDCPNFEGRYSEKIPFQSICDGIEEYSFEDLDGYRYTDESECDHWPCENLYSRCDGFWQCCNGEDEENCPGNRFCPSGRHPCLSPRNYSLSCLTSERVGDGIADCFGASDEVEFCREMYPLKKDYPRFRCLQSDLCLPISDLCDQIQSCPLGDDEKFCSNFPVQCQRNSMNNQSLIEHVLCQFSEIERTRKISFSLHTSQIYPRSKSSSINSMDRESIERSPPSIKTIESRMTHRELTWNCHRGLPVRIWSENDPFKFGCMCPPSYYGHLCQYQNERISLTLGLIRARNNEIYTIVLMLIDDEDREQRIHSSDLFDYQPSQSCAMKFNRYLLYPTRPKNMSMKYSVRIDIYEKRTMQYRASWYLSIPFLFLPVNRLVARLMIPYSPMEMISSCSLNCHHGECLKYMNKEKEFCRCYSGWSGIECNISYDCQSCSFDSICIGRIDHRSICLCPLTKSGPRCFLRSSCPLNACQNNGQCIPADTSDYHCICSEAFYGSKCQFIKARLDVSIENLNIPGYLIAFFFTISEDIEPQSTILIEKLTLFQHLVTFRISIPYHLVIIESNEKFYLAVVHQTPKQILSTSINPTRECLPLEDLFNSSLLKLAAYQRIKYLHLPCQRNVDLPCFVDENYLCLCTEDHQSNCLKFDRSKKLSCSSRDSCSNQGRCFQDHPQCPSSIICVCQECFFGDHCQFYGKGFGLTLDQILAYEIQPNVFFFEQNFAVQLAGGMTMLMFSIGLINGICSILTFQNQISQEVGCGMYLLASSMTSLIIVILFALKFWFLLFSYSDWFAQQFVLYTNCLLIEPLLKILLYTDNWFNGCIAIERGFAVFKGIYFNKNQSKFMAKWVITIVISVNVVLFLPQWLNMHLFNDEKERRIWCVILYSSKLDIYNSSLIIMHFFTPFLLNFSSAIFIIIETARQRVATQTKQFYSKEFRKKFKQHKHLLLSPILVMLLSLPRLILTFQLDCHKSSEHFWLYLFAYFVSFIPAVLVFVIFVLPSVVFKKAFQQAILRTRRRLSLFKMKFLFQ